MKKNLKKINLKKQKSKKKLFTILGSAILVVPILSIGSYFIVQTQSSIENNNNNAKPEDTSKPNNPNQPNIPEQSNPNNLTREQLFTIKRPKTQNNEIVGISVANEVGLPIAKNVHVVDDSLSNLPTFFVKNPEELKKLFDFKRNDFNLKIEILDYSDAFRYTVHRTYFPNYNNSNPNSKYESVLAHTDISGRAKYKLNNIDENYNKLSQFITNFDYSFIDLRLIFENKTNSQQTYSFNETILFREGIGEVIFGERATSNIIKATENQKQITQYNVSNTFQGIQKQVYETIVDINATPFTFHNDILNNFVAIQHGKFRQKFNQVNSVLDLTDFKDFQPLPSFLDYSPILKFTSKDPNDTYSGLIIGDHKVEILVENRNSILDQNLNSLRWHNFGKPNAIDYYYRGDLFATEFNLNWQFNIK